MHYSVLAISNLYLRLCISKLLSNSSRNTHTFLAYTFFSLLSDSYTELYHSLAIFKGKKCPYAQHVLGPGFYYYNCYCT